MDEYDEQSLTDEVSSYLEEIENNRVLSEEEEKAEVEKALKGNRESASLLVESFALRAEELASFRFDGTVPLMELIQEANRALYYAVAHLDAIPLNCSFSSYATTLINSRFDHYVKEEGEKMREVEEENSLDLDSSTILPKEVDASNGTALFLNAVSHYQLLSEEDEKTLGGLVQKGLKEGASEEEKKEGKQAEDRLVNSNLRLAMSVARNYLNHGVPFLDLVQEGYFGLQRAAQKFDPSRGCRFSTYAYPWIMQAMQRLVDEQGKGIKMSRHAISRIAKVQKAIDDLRLSLGRDPTLSEISAALPGYDEKDISAIMEIPTSVLSLDAPFNESESDSADLLSTIRGDDDLNEAIDEDDRRREVEKGLKALNDRERTIITYLFGLDGKERMDMSELGRKFGISRERIRQIQVNALSKMKRALLGGEKGK